MAAGVFFENLLELFREQRSFLRSFEQLPNEK
jgi:hypothetical protein